MAKQTLVSQINNLYRTLNNSYINHANRSSELQQQETALKPILTSRHKNITYDIDPKEAIENTRKQVQKQKDTYKEAANSLYDILNNTSIHIEVSPIKDTEDKRYNLSIQIKLKEDYKVISAKAHNQEVLFAIARYVNHPEFSETYRKQRDQLQVHTTIRSLMEKKLNGAETLYLDGNTVKTKKGRDGADLDQKDYEDAVAFINDLTKTGKVHVHWKELELK